MCMRKSCFLGLIFTTTFLYFGKFSLVKLVSIKTSLSNRSKFCMLLNPTVGGGLVAET